MVKEPVTRQSTWPFWIAGLVCLPLPDSPDTHQLSLFGSAHVDTTPFSSRKVQAELEKPRPRKDKVPCSVIPQNRLIPVKLRGGDGQSSCSPGPRPRPALDAPPPRSVHPLQPDLSRCRLRRLPPSVR